MKFQKGNNLGRKFQKGHKINLGRSGIKKPSHSKFMIGNKYHLGKQHTKETKEKMRRVHIGDKNPNWKGGTTLLTQQIRHHFKYRQWRSDVFMRDKFICQECGNKSGSLNAHHINSFSIILRKNNITTLEQALNCEELWNLNNGITLCIECHNKTKK